MKSIEDRADKVISEYAKTNNPEIFKKFIQKELRGFITKKKQQELYKVLPKLIEKTDKYNYRWLDVYKLWKVKGIREEFIKNVYLFNFNIENTYLQTIIPLRLRNTDDDFEISLFDNLDKSNIDSYTTRSIIDMSSEMLKNILLETGFRKYNNRNVINALTTTAIAKERFDLIEEHIEKILYNDPNPIMLKQLTKDFPTINQKIMEYIESNKEECVAKILQNKLKQGTIIYKDKCLKETGKNGVLDITDQSILKVLYLLINEICLHENVKFSDINKIGEGITSEVYEIGNKVIKFGTRRGTAKFHNNPYINKPLIRKTLKLEDEYENEIFIEVNEKVDTESRISEEELYQLYEKVRDIGLIWLDVDFRNAGRLLKDNEINWNRDLNQSDEALELNQYRDGIKLKKGDLVILDNDHIIDENNDKSKYGVASYLQKKFEYQYQLKKRLKENDNKENDIELSKENITK